MHIYPNVSTLTPALKAERKYGSGKLLRAAQAVTGMGRSLKAIRDYKLAKRRLDRGLTDSKGNAITRKINGVVRAVT